MSIREAFYGKNSVMGMLSRVTVVLRGKGVGIGSSYKAQSIKKKMN